MPKRNSNASSALVDSPTISKRSDRDDRQRSANEVKVETLDVPDWSALRKLPKEHHCGPRCIESLRDSTVHLPYEDRDSVCSPYFVPLLHGWTRTRGEKRNGELQVCYKAPCGRRFRNGETAVASIVEYLQITGMAEHMRLTIDMFTFHVNAEPEKLATGVGRKLTSDLSIGRERVPIPVVNNVNDEPLPDFVYMRERAILPWNVKDANDASAESYRDDCSGCDCQDNCLDATKCQCQQGSTVYDGRIRKKAKSTAYEGNRECNHKCACRRKQSPAGTSPDEHDIDQEPLETCVNRVAQSPLNIPLEVYQTAEHGWAVRSRVWLPPGRHVCNYSAPYLTESTASSSGRQDSVYLMNVGYYQGPKTPKKFVIDGNNVGNVGRFFSHSCRPNMTCHSVFTDTHDTRLPVAALFTRKVVKPGDPLTYHYGPKYVKKDKRTGVTIMAGSFPCGCDECAKNAKAK